MNGLELARRFFQEWGLSYLKQNHPELTDRLAAGLIGRSQSVGLDDEISHDHDWGPGFQIWLLNEDHARSAETLAEELHAALPDEFFGYRLADGWGRKAKSVQIHSMDSWFKDETGGFAEPPENPLAFQPSPRDESHLFFIKRGHVFHDPYGEFTRRRAGFSVWPRYSLLKRLHNTTWQLWHFGEYNFERVVRRGDPLTISHCKTEFTDYTMRVCFLLNEDFAPYWKWSAACFRRISWAGPIAHSLDALNACASVEDGKAHVESICRALRDRLVISGFVTEGQAEDWGHAVIDAEIRGLEERHRPPTGQARPECMRIRAKPSLEKGEVM